MIFKLIKIWLTGLLIYLSIIFLIPTEHNNQNVNKSHYIINLNGTNNTLEILQIHLNNLLYKKQNTSYKIIINRLEFIIYYLFFQCNISYNNYELYVVNQNMNLKNILFIYHKTIYYMLYKIYILIKNYIIKLKGNTL